MNKPSYYSIITAEVRYDKRLTDSHKILFSELTALTSSTGECWATNGYLADLYGVSVSTITRRINTLKKYGYIDVEMIYKKDSKEIDKRIVRIATPIVKNEIPIGKFDYRGIVKPEHDPIGRIDQDSITSKSSITSISNKDKGISISVDKKSSTLLKRPYGEFENVLLTDEELSLLKTNHSDWSKRIEDLSLYIGSMGKSYKSHYMTILSWIRRDKSKSVDVKNNLIKHEVKMPQYTKPDPNEEDPEELEKLRMEAQAMIDGMRRNEQ